MYKALLFVLLSLQAFCCVAQSVASGQSPSEQVTGDPAHTLYDLACHPADQSGVLLTWKLSSPLPDFLAIERSDNGRLFEVVTVLNNLNVQSLYQWIDEAPKKGKSFYRIRYSFNQDRPLYSSTVSYLTAGSPFFRFYPNPVDHILIVRSDSPIDVSIVDANGKTRITEPKVQGLHTINVSALDKGVYLIRFSNKLTNVISQEKLLKN